MVSLRASLAALALLWCVGSAHAIGGNQVVTAANRPAVGQDFAAVVETVRASWYGGGEYLNAHTSTGERFNARDRTCAHRTLPFGSRIEVTYQGRSTVCRVNDRGPAAYTGRSLDLSRAAAEDIGLIAAGVGAVTLKILH